MEQKYKVKGDFDLMLHWDEYFGETATESNDTSVKSENKSNAKTNMMILLLPWIVFWVSTSINSYNGSFISIVTCALSSLLFFKNKKTIYDIISNTAVIIFSIMILLGYNTALLLPISYFGFGAMWSISCLNKILFTAWFQKWYPAKVARGQ